MISDSNLMLLAIFVLILSVFGILSLFLENLEKKNSDKLGFKILKGIIIGLAIIVGLTAIVMIRLNTNIYTKFV